MNGAHPFHGLHEFARALRVDMKLDSDQDGPVVEVGINRYDWFGPVQGRRQIERALGEMESRQNGNPDDQAGGGAEQRKGNPLPLRQQTPRDAATGHAAHEDEEIDGQRPGAHPAGRDCLDRDVEAGKHGHPGDSRRQHGAEHRREGARPGQGEGRRGKDEDGRGHQRVGREAVADSRQERGPADRANPQPAEKGAIAGRA